MKTAKQNLTAGKITEEVLNSTIHGVGAILGIIGLVYGIFNFSGSTAIRIGFVVYGISLIVLMLMSSLYHALIFSRAKSVFQKIDHSSILLLIAGSYTPFVIYLYSGVQMLVGLIIIWSIAVLGILMKTTMPNIPKKYSMGLFIGFGWLALFFVPKLSELSQVTLVLLFAGGVIYTLGAGIMAFKKPFTHVGWHVMVVIAAVAHYGAIMNLS